MTNCQGTKSDGEPCSRKAANGTNYCWQHKGNHDRSLNLSSADAASRVGLLLEAITANNGPGGLDLQRANLSGLTLTPEALLARRRNTLTDIQTGHPLWLIRRFDQPGLNLIGAVLRDASITATKMPYCRLQLADLEGADFYGTDLSGADLYRANLKSASLYRADLRNAKLERATLLGADLRSCDLRGANLLRANLAGALLHREAFGKRLLQEDEEEYRRFLTDDRRIEDFALAVAVAPTGSRSNLYPLYDQTWQALPAEAAVIEEHLRMRLIEAREVYLALRTCFLEQGRTEDASWAHFNERKVRQRALLPSQAKKYNPEWRSHGRFGPKLAWLSGRNFLWWMREGLYRMTCGFGERPLRAVVSMLVVASSYTFIFSTAGRFRGPGDRLTVVEAAIVSWASLAGLNAGPAPDNHFTEALVVSEAAVGLALFALLMFTLGNRLSKG